MKPVVSFIVAAHNAAAFIAEAIQSALAQTVRDVEVIVVDDASTDGTPLLAEQAARQDGRVRVIRLPENAGPSAARNAALDVASGDWLAVLDADDTVEPMRTEYLLDLAAASGAEIVADNLRLLKDPPGRGAGVLLERGDRPYLLTLDQASFVRNNAIFQGPCRLGYLKPMFRAAAVKPRHVRYDTRIRIGEDYHFCLDVLLGGARYVVSSEPLYVYRVGRESLSRRLRRSDLESLIAVHDEVASRPNLAGDTELRNALDHRRRSLERALTYTVFVDRVKDGQPVRAIADVAPAVDAWPLIGRFAWEAAMKRLQAGWRR